MTIPGAEYRGLIMAESYLDRYFKYLENDCSKSSDSSSERTSRKPVKNSEYSKMREAEAKEIKSRAFSTVCPEKETGSDESVTKKSRCY
ncbi:unnamed protein product [Onchocerca flexuosa]|uniref:Uncharacterized protein n=1 Tax=Onchocerca flexuosa TaxID=387005 RepID=A0A183HEQ9_9BILA|nr:unnamed protein product [Onchocerca flexuosa]